MPERKSTEEMLADAERLFKGAGLTHDFLHTKRVLNLALEVAKSLTGIDKRLLTAVCCFHDAGRTAPRKGVNHAIISAEWATAHFPEYGFSEEETYEGAKAIETHSWSLGLEPVNRIGEILQDCDRIDALGAIGLARMFAFQGGERGMYNPDDPFCESGREPDQSLYAVDHAYQKLFRLPGMLRLPECRKIAEKRAGFMRTFFEAMRDEISGRR